MGEVFKAIDSVFAAVLPAGARLSIYGLVVGALAMWIYWKVSPQKRIAAVKVEMGEAQRALRAYSGTDGREVMRLSKQAIGAAGKQVLLVVGPGLLAMAPVVLVMAGLGKVYGGWEFGGIGGPGWLRSWETVFMAGLTVAVVGMKVGLKIA